MIVQVGGRSVPPSYAGPAPGLPDGCYVSVLVKAGGSTSNEATIPKASRPGACAHPFGLSGEALATLDALVMGETGTDRGHVMLGWVTIQNSVDAPPAFPGNPFGYTRFEAVSVQFRNRDAFEMAQLARPRGRFSGRGGDPEGECYALFYKMVRPGTERGPCEPTCTHKACAEIRKTAASKCRRCRQPIGYGPVSYLHPKGLVHADCSPRSGGSVYGGWGYEEEYG